MRIIFKFESDDEDTAEGFYLDNFSISGYTFNPLDVNEERSREQFELLYIPGGFEVIPLMNSRHRLVIYDVTGRVVKTEPIDGRRIYRIKGLTSGVYFVRVGKSVKRITLVR